MTFWLCRDIQRFEQSSSHKYSTATVDLSLARQQAVDALKMGCNERLAKLSIVILSDDDENDSPPAKKSLAQLPPRLTLSAVSDDEDDIGHVKVLLHFVFYIYNKVNLLMR